MPIFKKGSKHDISNYRSVSLASDLWNTIERFGCVAIHLYSTEHSSLDDAQHGVAPKRAPITNLRSIQQDVSTLLDKKRGFDIVFRDLLKAFDMVNYRLLLAKTEALSI